MLVRLTLSIMGLVVGLLMLEGVALLFAGVSDRSITSLEQLALEEVQRAYSEDELRDERGIAGLVDTSACVRQRPARPIPFRPFIGFSAKEFDAECFRRQMAEHGQPGTSVLFLGGSVMANALAPNRRTAIDTYFQREMLVPTLTLNLAESGARLSNSAVRLLTEGVAVPTTFAVFLDGFNEFNSIRYGGQPEDDFYWTAGIQERIEAPATFLVRRVLEMSRVTSFLFFQTGILRSARVMNKAPGTEKVRQAARFYVVMQERAARLARANGIEPLFFLQPHLFSKRILSPTEAAIAEAYERQFPGMGELLHHGYQVIREESKEPLIDLSGIFELDSATRFVDAVHLGKEGNERIAMKLAEQVTLRLRSS